MAIWGSKVVVVDDDQDTLDIVTILLHAAGAQIVAVRAPGEALTTVMGGMPDVLLVDIAMPGEDGLSLLRKLRTLSPEKGGRIPAAALTAWSATPERIEEWRQAGFQRYSQNPSSPTISSRPLTRWPAASWSGGRTRSSPRPCPPTCGATGVARGEAARPADRAKRPNDQLLGHQRLGNL